MKKLLALVVVLMIAVLATAGCSKHESDIAEEQRIQQEEMERYLEEGAAGGAEDKVPDANAPVVEIIAIYYPAEGTKGIVMDMADVPELDDWELTQKLIEFNVLPSSAQIIDYEPDKGIIEYTGVSTLTPRQAQAVINTFAENMEIPGQITLKLDGKEVLTSGYNAGYEDIDDTYKGGADDGIGDEYGPGTKK